MPCSDGGPSPQQVRESSDIPAALCAILTVLEYKNALDDTLERVDWAEAGVSPTWLRAWWELHKENDRRRLLRERLRIEAQAKRQAVLDKLTPEERRDLGVRDIGL